MNDSNKNSYDNMVVDIDRLFEKKIKKSLIARPGFLQRFITRYINAFQIKTGLITPMLESGLKRKWFIEFRDYWYEALEGRPLYLHDFYFLLGIYRQKFQNVETPDYAEKKEFLVNKFDLINTWQGSLLYFFILVLTIFILKRYFVLNVNVIEIQNIENKIIDK